MPAPLIKGCINPIIRDQVIDAIDNGCANADTNDPICDIFRSQLASLPECAVQHHTLPERLPTPTIQREPTPQEPKVMTDYQKHMSVCRKRKIDFNECITLWDKTSPEHPNGLHREYDGSEYTKTRLK
jgi:hypothetical protein